MTIRTKDDHKVKMYEDDIARLVDAVAKQNVGRICWAARYLSESADAISKIDIAEYEAEIERRRQIGLTIDPATVEMKFLGRPKRSVRRARGAVSGESVEARVLCGASRRNESALSRSAQSNAQSSVGERRATDGACRVQSRSRAPPTDRNNH